jgi:hypothetical protein
VRNEMGCWLDSLTSGALRQSGERRRKTRLQRVSGQAHLDPLIWPGIAVLDNSLGPLFPNTR